MYRFYQDCSRAKQFSSYFWFKTKCPSTTENTAKQTGN